MSTPSDKQTLHADPITVTLNGETHELRRPGVRDVFTVGRIVSRGAAIALQEGQDLSGMTGEQLMTMFAVGLPYAEDDGMKLVASLLQVDVEDLDDTHRFPPTTILDVGEALAESEDVKAFLTKSVALFQRGGRKTRTTSRKRSAS